MKKITILSFNKMGVDYWSLRTGNYESVNYHDFSEILFRNEANKYGNIIVVDFYTYSQPSINKQKELLITSKLLDIIQNKDVSLFIMSPMYSNWEIQKIQNKEQIIALHNYSITFFKTLHNQIHQINNLVNSQMAS